MRKDEIVLDERGLFIESWLPERRSRRRPHYYLHGELTGSWLWERYLRFFAQRGWEGHALNLRAHFWSETAPLEELDLETYVDDAVAGYDALDRAHLREAQGQQPTHPMSHDDRRPVERVVAGDRVVDVRLDVELFERRGLGPEVRSQVERIAPQPRCAKKRR